MVAIISDLQIERGRIRTIRPQHTSRRRTLFLSNIDQNFVAFFVKFVHFFAFPVEMPFDAIAEDFMEVLSRLLDAYDFMCGRLGYDSHQRRFEIDCNGEGVPFVVATSQLSLESLGDVTFPNPAFSQLCYVSESQREEHHLISFQVTGFQSGGMALGCTINHCLMDGFALQEFTRNLTHLATTGELAFMPLTDRTLLKARSPLQIKHPHHECKHPSTPTSKYSPFLPRKGSRDAWFNKMALQNPSDKYVLGLFTLPAEMIGLLKMKAVEGGVEHCTRSIAVLAHLWRARSAAIANKKSQDTSTLLFVVDTRSKVEPPIPPEYAGNAIMMAYAKATWREVQELPFAGVVKKVQKGVERINDEYVRSAIDWLELHDGVPCLDENGFLVTSWSHMGFTDMEIGGGIRSFYGGGVPTAYAGSVVVLLSTPEGSHIIIGLEPAQMARFENLIHNVDIYNTTSKL